MGENEYYLIRGAVATEDSSESLAKKTKKCFFIKKATRGSDTGFLINPYGANYLPGTAAKKESRTGRQLYEYAKVKQECFDLYIKFLRTENLSYYRNAQRSLIDG